MPHGMSESNRTKTAAAEKRRKERERKARAERQARIDAGKRKGGGGPDRSGRRNASNVTPGSNPLSRATPTKPGQSAYREEQEARRKKGQSYNPNKTPRKPSVEPGTNRLSRHARDQDRKAAAAKAAAKAKAERERQARNNRTKPPVKAPVKPPVKAPAKPTKPATKTKPSNQPANAGAGNGAPRPAEVKPAKEHHIKSSRLRDALKSVKKYKPKK